MANTPLLLARLFFDSGVNVYEYRLVPGHPSWLLRRNTVILIVYGGIIGDGGQRHALIIGKHRVDEFPEY